MTGISGRENPENRVFGLSWSMLTWGVPSLVRLWCIPGCKKIRVQDGAPKAMSEAKDWWTSFKELILSSLICRSYAPRIVECQHGIFNTKVLFSICCNINCSFSIVNFIPHTGWLWKWPCWRSSSIGKPSFYAWGEMSTCKRSLAVMWKSFPAKPLTL